MGNRSKNLKIIIGVLSILIISLLVGCTSNNNTQSGTSEPVDVASVESDSDINMEQDIDEEQQEVSTTNSVDDSIKEETDTEPADQIVEIFPISGPKPLHMEPREPFRLIDLQQRNGVPSLAPIYGEDWRMQVVSFKGNNGVFEIGNTGSTDLVIDDSKMIYVLYDNGGNNIAGSYIVGGPVTIAPDEVKTVTVKAKHAKAQTLVVDINGYELYFRNREEGENIVDTTPYTAPMDDYNRRIESMPEVVRVLASNTVSGNGKFKFVVEGVQLIENDKIGSFKKSERYSDSMLGLVKVKIANTSNVDMVISDIWEVFFLSDSVGDVDIPLDAIKALGESGLPLTIKAGEIAEGYIPFSFLGSEFIHSLAFETNMGYFSLDEIESFQVLK